MLSGGSAFGLDAAQGVMRYLEEHNIGYKVGAGVVPIVPAAILFDLGFGGDWKIRPTADCGYKAAAGGDRRSGRGRQRRRRRRRHRRQDGRSRAAIDEGRARIRRRSLCRTVSSSRALVAVNAVGDVIDPRPGKVVAGVRTEDGKGLADVRKLLRAGALMRRAQPRAGENTTIGRRRDQRQADQGAGTEASRRWPHDGYARAISPSHTPGDGDTMFSLATGRVDQRRRT